MRKDNKGTYLILFLLLVVAAVLRLYHPMEIPFSADELDALGRTKFNTFSELISKGVIIDAHPAGVEVFLYYWTKIFGYSELAVKLPFITFGVLSVLYMFKLGKEWFNSTVGLVCAAFIATLQYTILFSQVARPNISGLFFTLAMVFYWSKAMFKPEKNYRRNIVLYVLFSALCAYNHYYSLLIAAIVGVTGLFFIQRKYLVWYVAAGLSIFILYIPHLHIFFYQYNVGGLKGIVGAPHNRFIIDYIEYVFHFTKYVYLCVAVLFLVGIISTLRKKGKKVSRFMVISMCWFGGQFLITFLYSVFVNPIMEYSSLIFTFPFMLFCLFGWLPELALPWKVAVVGVLCLVDVSTLFLKRHYYDMFYKSRYEQEVLLTDSVIKAHGINNIVPFLHMNDDDSIPQYYIKKHHLDVPYINIEYPKGKLASLVKILDNNKGKEYMSFGGLARSSDPVLMSIFFNYYPYLVKQANFDQGSFFLLTSKQSEGRSPYIFESVNDFEKPCQYWDAANKTYVSDTVSYSGKHSYLMDSLNEWGPAFCCDLNKMIKNRDNLILISVALYSKESLKDVAVVAVVSSGDKQLFYGSYKASDFMQKDTCCVWVKAYHGIKLPDVYLEYPDIKVKVYIWNSGKKNFYMDDFSVRTIDGNPLIYWLLEKPTI